MIVARTVPDVRAVLADRRRGRIGLVPTMGALHDGHLALLEAARAACDTVVMSLFVNPAQFGEPGDLNGYPRDETRDLELAEASCVDVVFAPSAAEMYPPGYQTWVEVTELGSTLEGVHRPGHFRGVATVCLKLFTIVGPDLAFYGQKDAQQIEVLRRMVSDLHLELELVVVPTVRDPDGLALFSQLSPLARGARRPPCAGGRRSRRAMPRRRARFWTRPASRSTTSRSRRSTHRRSPPPSASAPPA